MKRFFKDLKKCINEYKNQCPSYIKLQVNFFQYFICFRAVEKYTLGKISRKKAEAKLNKYGLSLNVPK